MERGLGLYDGRHRRHVAVAVTADGHRVLLRAQSGLVDVTVRGILYSLLRGLEGLLGLLITGSRRENGGTR